MKRIVLVTGASRGIGKNIALSAAKIGYDVIISYHTKKEDAAEVVSEIENLGQSAIALQLDVFDSSSVATFVDQVNSCLRENSPGASLHALVNNAGTGSYEPIAQTTEDSLDKLYNMHFKSVFLLAKAFSQVLEEGGCVINISSGYSRFSATGFSAYGAMKAAIDTLSRYQAVEFAARKIRVNSIAPGAIETDFAGGIVRDNADINNYVASQTALGRTGQANDIGGVVAFLLSDAAKWINGQRLEVSGGIFL